MRTSARNQYLGVVTSIKKGAVNSEVILDIGAGTLLTATITNDSVEHLALESGLQAHALIKASWIILAVDDNLKTSASNCLTGIVAQCIKGAVNSEVIIELLGGKTLAAIVTNESIKTLGMKVGIRAHALINASHIILAVTA